MSPQPTSDVYIHIQNPSEIRRNVLESTKFLIQVLKKYEQLSETRTKKTEEIDKLKVILGDINTLFSQIKEDLPKVDPSLLPKKKKVVPVPPAPKKEVVVPKAAPVKKSQLDHLDDELSTIEEKLRRL